MPYAQTVMSGGVSAQGAQAMAGGGASGLVAVGTTNADALQLGALTAHQITTSSASTGVILKAGVPGDWCVVENNSGQTIYIYPPSGAQINALTATTQGLSSANGKNTLLVCISATKWLAVVSA